MLLGLRGARTGDSRVLLRVDPAEPEQLLPSVKGCLGHEDVLGHSRERRQVAVGMRQDQRLEFPGTNLDRIRQHLG